MQITTESVEQTEALGRALAARLQTAIDAMREDGTAEAIVEKYGFDAEKSLGGGN